jgi:hypothetical protein
MKAELWQPGAKRATGLSAPSPSPQRHPRASGFLLLSLAGEDFKSRISKYLKFQIRMNGTQQIALIVEM